MERGQFRFPLELTEDFLPSILLGVLVESLLYGRPPYFKLTEHIFLPPEFDTGMHAILFFICVLILVRRRRILQMVMLGAVVVMFILATVDIGISWNITLRHTASLYAGGSVALEHRIYAKFLLYVVNNLIADALLVLRCYVVWERKMAILLPSGIALAIGTAFGFMSEGTTSVSLKKYIIVYILMTVCFNLCLTLLTAGRIYWIAREVKSIMGHEMGSQYHFAVVIVIESGLIYTLANILVLSLSPTKLILMAAALSIRIVCIVPILIVVQITLGQSTNLKGARMTATPQTGTQIVFNTIVSSDRYDSEAGLNTRPPTGVEISKDNPSLADESTRNDIILERRTEEI